MQEGEHPSWHPPPPGEPWWPPADHRRGWRWGPHREWPGWESRRRFGPPRWHRRRNLFLQFAAVFGFAVVLVIGGMAGLAYLLARLFEGGGQAAVLVWVGGCSLSLALPLLGIAVAIAASRRITHPLADVMDAADAVAGGDLSTRVPEEDRPGDLGRLARTFNRMIGELQRIDEQRKNLTADVAHELRTPLHVIRGNLEGILDGVYQPTPEHIQMLLDETHLLARLVDDLRTLSLAESGHLTLHIEPVDVAELLADAGTSFGGQAEAAGIALKVETGALTGATLPGDVGRLNQVLANLMANALRYTPPGGTITLRGERAPGGVILSVRDTGKGIPAEDLPHVFDRFWRGDPARTRADGSGGGLGLAIVRQLVQLHGGRVAVRSEVGRGSTFTLFLPDAHE
jgi:two-component system sensor histidine kinase BaeS